MNDFWSKILADDVKRGNKPEKKRVIALTDCQPDFTCTDKILDVRTPSKDMKRLVKQLQKINKKPTFMNERYEYTTIEFPYHNTNFTQQLLRLL